MERQTPPPEDHPDDVTGHPGMRRAGPGMVLLFLLIPPVGGSLLAASVLTHPGRVPGVLLVAFFVGVATFLAASPLAERSQGFRVALYRRLAESAVLLGFTSGVVVLYTLLVYLLLGFRRPWAADLFRAVPGG
ncbi:MAG TPA: hypothetical protein VLA43_03505 [Longimicrobiales bacterium]|nr:hypothetical protein [Longimicrobiales bacterium]